MEEERKVVRITKEQMARMRWLMKHAESEGHPIPSLQKLYDHLLKIGMDALEAGAKLPEPADGHVQIVVDVPVHRVGRRPKSEGAPFRHYLHGDPVVGSNGKYYCKRCDAFELSEHFGGDGPGASASGRCGPGITVLYGSDYRLTHEYRYVQERRRWFGASTKAHARRGSRVAVDDPGNLFRTGTVREQHLPKLERA